MVFAWMNKENTKLNSEQLVSRLTLKPGIQLYNSMVHSLS